MTGVSTGHREGSDAGRRAVALASFRNAVYLRGMTAARLIRLLTILALLLAPLSMVDKRAAMAMPSAPAAAMHHAGSADRPAHCPDMAGSSQDETAPDRDCLVDCAISCSAIPAAGSAMVNQPMATSVAQPLPLLGLVSGLHPESDPPPPRFA